MRQIFLWVAEGKTLSECAELAGCHISTISARVKKFPGYQSRLEEARRLSAESHLHHAGKALDLSIADITKLGKAATPYVALRKAQSELHVRKARFGDRERLSDMVKPTPPTPTMIIAINGMDMVSRRSVASEITRGLISVDEEVPIEALSFRKSSEVPVGK